MDKQHLTFVQFFFLHEKKMIKHCNIFDFQIPQKKYSLQNLQLHTKAANHAGKRRKPTPHTLIFEPQYDDCCEQGSCIVCRCPRLFELLLPPKLIRHQWRKLQPHWTFSFCFPSSHDTQEDCPANSLAFLACCTNTDLCSVQPPVWMGLVRSNSYQHKHSETRRRRQPCERVNGKEFTCTVLYARRKVSQPSSLSNRARVSSRRENIPSLSSK